MSKVDRSFKEWNSTGTKAIPLIGLNGRSVIVLWAIGHPIEQTEIVVLQVVAGIISYMPVKEFDRGQTSRFPDTSMQLKR